MDFLHALLGFLAIAFCAIAVLLVAALIVIVACFSTMANIALKDQPETEYQRHCQQCGARFYTPHPDQTWCDNCIDAQLET